MELLLRTKDFLASFVLGPHPVLISPQCISGQSSTAHLRPAQLVSGQSFAAHLRPAQLVSGQRRYSQACIALSHEQAGSFPPMRSPAHTNSSSEQLYCFAFISPQARRSLQGAKLTRAPSDPARDYAPGGKACHTISDPTWDVLIGSHSPTLQGMDCSDVAVESFWNN